VESARVTYEFAINFILLVVLLKDGVAAKTDSVHKGHLQLLKSGIEMV